MGFHLAVFFFFSFYHELCISCRLFFECKQVVKSKSEASLFAYIKSGSEAYTYFPLISYFSTRLKRKIYEIWWSFSRMFFRGIFLLWKRLFEYFSKEPLNNSANFSLFSKRKHDERSEKPWTHYGVRSSTFLFLLLLFSKEYRKEDCWAKSKGFQNYVPF